MSKHITEALTEYVSDLVKRAEEEGHAPPMEVRQQMRDLGLLPEERDYLDWHPHAKEHRHVLRKHTGRDWGVWTTGGGCHALGIKADEGRTVIVACDARIPYEDEEHRWGGDGWGLQMDDEDATFLIGISIDPALFDGTPETWARLVNLGHLKLLEEWAHNDTRCERMLEMRSGGISTVITHVGVPYIRS